MRVTSIMTILAVAASASAIPMRRQNNSGPEATAQNAEFAAAKAGDACEEGTTSCAGDQLAQCVGGVLVAQDCAATTVCRALPLVNSEGTSIACVTQAEADQRIADAGGAGGGADAGAAADADAGAADAGAADAGAADAGAADAGAADAGDADADADAADADADAADADADAADADAGAADADAGAAAQNNAGAAGGGDPQTSTTLDPAVIAAGFANDGQEPPVEGQAASLTSTNNFINFCLDKGEITNGKQVKAGSCNPCPIGQIPSFDNMPSSKFVFPPNGANDIPANQDFTIEMAIQKIQTGTFVNAQNSYFAAPQQLNGEGQIIGHTHVTIESIPDLGSTTPLDPRQFQFFKGVNTPAEGGVVSALVEEGVPAGAYRLCSMNAAANHQPLIVSVAQHGSLDDCVYFTAV